MKLSPATTDNVTEILVKILKFTQARQKLLMRNINNIHKPGFIPKDLAVEEFSQLLEGAINEHVAHQRLVLIDTENIKFGRQGYFKAGAVVDEHAVELLETDRDEYLHLQVSKLLENALNQKVAAELLKHKRGKRDVF